MGAGICGPAWRPGATTEGLHDLKLQAIYAPVGASEGSTLCGIAVGDVIELMDLAHAKEVECMSWRYSETYRNARPSKGGRAAMSKEDDELPPWPNQRCFTVHHRFWRAALPTKPGWFGILQMASNPSDRNVESLEEELAASVSIAAYAHKFNKQQSSEARSDPPPAIKVAAPIGCQIGDTGMSSMFSVGDAVVLYLLPCVADVQKMIFNGADPWVDVAQAFFHFVALSSGGRELAYDLQGIYDDSGDICIVDPAILKVSGKKEEATPTCGPLMGGGSEGLEWGHFQALHPKCSPLCKAFDPHRAVRLGRSLACCG